MMSPMVVENRLLKGLTRKALKSVLAECELVQLTAGDILSESRERIRDAYFPTQTIISLVAKVAGNASLEVALVGDEGMVGLPLLLGADTKPQRTLVQNSGEAWRMKAETFKRMTVTNRALRGALNRYACLRLEQMAQNAICVSSHQIAARLARRLLMMQDRSHSDHFQASQESLASMLGVRRSGVTMAAITFQRRNFIQYNRGTLTVIDRKRLEMISCECYWTALERGNPNAG